eukprot:924850-Alexandrium_andersonii.AAC.1
MCIRDSYKASSGGFGVAVRAEPDGDDETGRRARRRRFSGAVREGGAPLGKTQCEKQAALR